MQISPNSAKIEVPEKCDIPGMERIGELFCKENSSIFLSISESCSSNNSIWLTRCRIWISSAAEGIPIEDLAVLLRCSAEREIRFPCPLNSKHLRILRMSAFATASAERESL